MLQINRQTDTKKIFFKHKIWLINLFYLNIETIKKLEMIADSESAKILSITKKKQKNERWLTREKFGGFELVNYYIIAQSYRELSRCFNISAFNIKHEQFQSNIVTKAELTDVFSMFTIGTVIIDQIVVRKQDLMVNVIIVKKLEIKKPILKEENRYFFSFSVENPRVQVTEKIEKRSLNGSRN